MALPEANERISHGEPTWFAGKGKVFAMLDDHHHGAPHLSVWLPAALGAQEALIDSHPKRYFRPAYVGNSGWVGVVLDDVAFEARLAVLKEQVAHHAHREEEDKLFPKVRSAMTRDERAALGNEFLVMFEELMQSHPYKNVPGETQAPAPLPHVSSRT